MKIAIVPTLFIWCGCWYNTLKFRGGLKGKKSHFTKFISWELYFSLILTWSTNQNNCHTCGQHLSITKPCLTPKITAVSRWGICKRWCCYHLQSLWWKRSHVGSSSTMHTHSFFEGASILSQVLVGCSNCFRNPLHQLSVSDHFCNFWKNDNPTFSPSFSIIYSTISVTLHGNNTMNAFSERRCCF